VRQEFAHQILSTMISHFRGLRTEQPDRLTRSHATGGLPVHYTLPIAMGSVREHVLPQSNGANI